MSLNKTTTANLICSSFFIAIYKYIMKMFIIKPYRIKKKVLEPWFYDDLWFFDDERRREKVSGLFTDDGRKV